MWARSAPVRALLRGLTRVGNTDESKEPSVSASPLPQDSTTISQSEHARRQKVAELMFASAEQLGTLDPRLRVIGDLYVAGEIGSEEFARRTRATMVR